MAVTPDPDLERKLAKTLESEVEREEQRQEPPPGDPELIDAPPETAVQDALRQAAKAAPPGTPDAHRALIPTLWLIGYGGLFVALLIAYPLIGSGVFGVPTGWTEILRRIAYVALVSAVVLLVVTAAEVFFLRHLPDPVARFNLIKVVHLAGWVFIGFVALTQAVSDIYAAATSLGLASLVLGAALQEPISSFFAWIYILIRKPYRVGDRVAIGNVRGDVISVGYLDTAVWEIGGPVSGDHPSGRLVKFPNRTVFDTPVFNYSWPLFPYIWNEIKVHIAYDADLEYVAQTMERVVAEEMGEVMLERVGQFRELLAQTPIDELEVRERPKVVFRVSEDTWIEAIVRYLVRPREASRVKTRLVPKLLAALNVEPSRASFPKGAAR